MENLNDFNENSDTLMEKLRKYSDGKTMITLQYELNRATLDIISKVAFGMNVGSINDDKNELNACILNSMEGFVSVLSDPFVKV